jgi:hypothetical protein
MSEFEPTSPDEAASGRLESNAISEQSFADGCAAPPPQLSPPPGAHRTPVRHLLSTRRRRWVSAAVLAFAATGISVGVSASPSVTAAASVASSSGSAGGGGSGGGASNARSAPAAGGAAGTVGSVSKSKFTLTTSAGQLVTIDEESSTKYEKGTRSTSANAITKGETVLVLGTTSGTTIKATQVIVGYTPTSSAAATKVIPFKSGAPTASKQVGQIPANWSQGSGTIVSGTAATKATEAALAAYPGAVVDRVVKLSNGEYNVHYIGVNWPHHVFVTANFKVVGAL